MTIEEEITRARREGVRNDASLPFLLRPGKEGSAAVLLVHGFTATPWEMRPLAEELAANGYMAMGVRLPGHGTSPEDLAGRPWEDWLEGVQRGLEILRREKKRIFGIGMSTGGLLLAHLSTHTRLEGLILLSPYLRLRHRLARAVPLLRFVHPFQQTEIPPSLSPFYYARRPLNGIRELQRLVRRVHTDLGKMNVPTLVVTAAGDRTVDPGSALDLFMGLGSDRKEFHMYGPEVPHILTTPENPRQRETFRLALNFLLSLERNNLLPGD